MLCLGEQRCIAVLPPLAVPSSARTWEEVAMRRQAAIMVVVTGLAGLAALVALAMAPGAGADEALPGVSGRVWVANRALNNVAVFEAATGDVLGVIPVGREPNSLTAPPGAGKVYVTNEADGTVSVISKATLSVVRTVKTGPGSHHIQSSPSGKYVFFGEYFTNRLGVIDTDSDSFSDYAASPNAAARTHAPWVDAARNRVYVTNEVDNAIAALDAQTGQLLWTLVVGARPSEIVVSPDGRVGYVSVRNENKLKVVDLVNRRITAETVVGTQPDTLQLLPDGRTLVVALRGSPAQASFVDTTTLDVRRIDLPGTTTGHEWLSPDGRYTFIALEGPGAVGVIDNSRLALVDVYAYPGGGRPHGVFYDPADREGRVRGR
jgi:YVTN family beta-propeller protein